MRFAVNETVPPHCLTVTLIPVATIGLSAVIGASTNAVNGAVSPMYFRRILGWEDVGNVWRASIAQGIFEGLFYGIAFSVIFTVVVGRVTRGQCPFAFAFRHLISVVAVIYGCWVVGGLSAMGLASLSGEFYRLTFPGVPEDFGEMLRYAWVGGSIWGALAGGLLSLVIGSFVFTENWRRSQRLRSSLTEMGRAGSDLT